MLPAFEGAETVGRDAENYRNHCETTRKASAMWPMETFYNVRQGIVYLKGDLYTSTSSVVIGDDPLSLICPRCDATDTVKRGFRQNKSLRKQRYRCNNCQSTFIEPDGFERMRFKPEAIVRAVHQHEDGFSLSKVKNHLWQHDNVQVSRWTISQWVRKYADFKKSAERGGQANHRREDPS